MHFSKIFKVKEGKLEKVKEWFNILNTIRREEALSTFSYEGITREIFVLFEGKDGNHYVIGLNEAEGEPKRGDPDVTINIEHNALKQECLESITNNGKIILDLKI